MAPTAVTALGSLLAPTSSVLELGSGRSTTWLAARAGSVLSVEADPGWAAVTRDSLAQAGLSGADVTVVSLVETPAWLGTLKPGSFDIVTIDCYENASVTRLDCLVAARPLVRPGGRLVLDDSDRQQLLSAPTLLSGWNAKRYVGIKSYPLMAVETTIFTAPHVPVASGGAPQA